jgi:hypothetical protein
MLNNNIFNGLYSHASLNSTTLVRVQFVMTGFSNGATQDVVVLE